MSNANQIIDSTQSELKHVYELLEKYYINTFEFLPKLLVGLLIFFIFYRLAIYLSKILNGSLKTQIDDVLLASFISRVAKIALISVGVLLFLNIIGLSNIATGILGTAGIGAFILGFAFKDIGENFLAGILLAFDRPFRVGDTVELKGLVGKVISLNLRQSQIKTGDGKDIYIPNSMILKNPVINYTIDGFLRYNFTIPLDYHSNIDKATKIILKELDKVEGILKEDKAPTTYISNLDHQKISLTVYYWLNTCQSSRPSAIIKVQLINNVLNALKEADFEFPSKTPIATNTDSPKSTT